MNLVIDIGNTFTKVAAFSSGTMIAFQRLEGDIPKLLRKFLHDQSPVDACIISSVDTDPQTLGDILDPSVQTLILDHSTPLPFRNNYLTPLTLGKDRIAGVAGALEIFPGKDVLVIDAGTAITYDLLTSDGTYHGGAISPGVRTRYQSLHTFTGRLPLLETESCNTLTGQSTAGSIHSGIMNGIRFEMEGFINEYSKLYPGLKIILTGGDHKYFDNQLKIKTFAVPNLVLEGLNYILHYNLELR